MHLQVVNEELSSYSVGLEKVHQSVENQRLPCFYFFFLFSSIKLKLNTVSESLSATRSSNSYFFPFKLLNFLFFFLKEEDPKNAMSKERQASSIKSKLLRLQKDIEKASRDQEGV